MSTNTIGVIIPVYNVEPYLHRCLDSILAQTYKNIQVILVDDGSTDHSGAICDAYAAKDERIVVLHQQNQGQSAARNAGLDYLFASTDCEYINFVDSDDWLHPQMLEILFQALQEHQVNMSICGFQRTSGEEVEVPSDFPITTWKPEDFYVQHGANVTVVWGILYKKSCFITMRYPVGKIHEDEFVTYKILFSCEEIAFVDAPFYAYFQNPTGTMLSPWTPNRLAAIDALFEQIAFFENNHYEQARLRAVKRMLQTIVDNLVLAKGVEDKSSTTYLRNLLKKQIKSYKKELGLSPGKTCYFYEAAYPGLMKLYWYGVAALKKLHLKK